MEFLMKNNLSPQVIKTCIFFSLLILLLGTTTSFASRPDSFADLAEELSPMVVNISTTQTVKTKIMPQFPFNNKELPDMFRRFFNMPHHPQMRQRKQRINSLGSGVIISKDGYIITNNHVVAEAEKINIRFANHEEVEAKIIGRDPKTDLALLKIEIDHDLEYVQFGDSDSLRVGDWVIAIGNPFGLEQTVTAGIVSAKGRRIGGTVYENFIQTDASINPGNSGGPLFDINGKMVGVNTAIFSRSGGNIGIGFAIPVNMAKNVVKQLKEDGKVTRGWLGVMIQKVDQELADEFSMEHPIGALVGEVAADSPAEKAGIKPGDIIVEYEGREITEMNMLPNLVAQTAVGEKVEIVLIRDGKRKEIKVKIAKLKEDELAWAGDEIESKLGMTVQELTPELAKSLDIEDTDGLIIAGINPGSPAASAGLRRGDIVLEINRQPIDDLTSYAKIIKQNKGKRILFLIKRNDHTRFVVVKPD
jgi:serine protease Do